MLFTPLVVGRGLILFGITGAPRLLLVGQMGRSPTFSTTLFAEAFNLDRELAVTTVAISSGAWLFTIAIRMWQFGF